MQQFVSLLAAAAALYPSLASASMRKVHRSPELSARDDIVMPTIINITTNAQDDGSISGVEKRDFPPVSYSYTLIGCVDEINNYPVRLFNHEVPWDKTTVSTCVQACFNSGPIDGVFGPHYIFASVVNGNKCYCDSAINVNAQVVDQGRCNHVCEAGPHEYCGGSREHQVYLMGQLAINPWSVYPRIIPSFGYGSGAWNYAGCFPDSPSNRALSGWHFSTDNMTPNRCAGHCWEQGYGWAGVEYGKECWCGSQNNAANTAVALSNCDQACIGDSTLSCGAPGFIDVYRANFPNRLTLPNV